MRELVLRSLACVVFIAIIGAAYALFGWVGAVVAFLGLGLWGYVRENPEASAMAFGAVVLVAAVVAAIIGVGALLGVGFKLVS